MKISELFEATGLTASEVSDAAEVFARLKKSNKAPTSADIEKFFATACKNDDLAWNLVPAAWRKGISGPRFIPNEVDIPRVLKSSSKIAAAVTALSGKGEGNLSDLLKSAASLYVDAGWDKDAGKPEARDIKSYFDEIDADEHSFSESDIKAIKKNMAQVVKLVMASVD
jgi:hypothetical protein